MRTFGLALAAVCTAHAACVPVAGERILLSDISHLLPMINSEQLPSSFIGWTPSPGVRRVLTVPELLRFAGVQSVALREQEVRDICVERSTTPLDEQAIREAIARIPELAGVDIELIDFLKINVPNGSLIFSMGNLPQPTGDDCNLPVTWRGRFVYDESRTLAVWAKVKLSHTRLAVKALRDIPAGVEIAADMLEVRPGREFPGRDQRGLLSISQAVGRKTLRTLHAGDEL